MYSEKLTKEIEAIINSFEIDCSVDEFKDSSDVNWGVIIEYQKLSEDFIREFSEELDWIDIPKYQKLSEDFIREFSEELDWWLISINQKLSEDFIREFAEKLGLDFIIEYQKLSEDFIREFSEKWNWNYIAAYQKLSEDFIREFSEKWNWNFIAAYQKISPEFVKEFDLKIDVANWLYKPTEFKKRQIVDCGEYECYDDYFIAYKAIRSDRYSVFNFQFQYLKDGIYECHADHTGTENSFGLSVWTHDEAKKYYDKGLIIRCKIRYEDVARLVHGSHKIRCTKIEVLD